MDPARSHAAAMVLTPFSSRVSPQKRTQITKNAKKIHTKIAKTDISVLIDILPGLRESESYCCVALTILAIPDSIAMILESITFLTFSTSLNFYKC